MARRQSRWSSREAARRAAAADEDRDRGPDHTNNLVDYSDSVYTKMPLLLAGVGPGGLSDARDGDLSAGDGGSLVAEQERHDIRDSCRRNPAGPARTGLTNSIARRIDHGRKDCVDPNPVVLVLGGQALNQRPDCGLRGDVTRRAGERRKG